MTALVLLTKLLRSVQSWFSLYNYSKQISPEAIYKVRLSLKPVFHLNQADLKEFA